MNVGESCCCGRASASPPWPRASSKGRGASSRWIGWRSTFIRRRMPTPWRRRLLYQSTAPGAAPARFLNVCERGTRTRTPTTTSTTARGGGRRAVAGKILVLATTCPIAARRLVKRCLGSVEASISCLFKCERVFPASRDQIDSHGGRAHDQRLREADSVAHSARPLLDPGAKNG